MSNNGPDVHLAHTPGGGEIDIENGIVSMNGGIRTATYLSMFGGNFQDAGHGDDNAQWWGNYAENTQAEKYRSETQHIIATTDLTTASLRRVKEAALRDLAWMTDSGMANTVEVEVSSPSLNKLEITVNIGAYGEQSEFKFALNWVAEYEDYLSKLSFDPVPERGDPPIPVHLAHWDWSEITTDAEAKNREATVVPAGMPSVMAGYPSSQYTVVLNSQNGLSGGKTIDSQSSAGHGWKTLNYLGLVGVTVDIYCVFNPTHNFYYAPLGIVSGVNPPTAKRATCGMADEGSSSTPLHSKQSYVDDGVIPDSYRFNGVEFANNATKGSLYNAGFPSAANIMLLRGVTLPGDFLPSSPEYSLGCFWIDDGVDYYGLDNGIMYEFILHEAGQDETRILAELAEKWNITT